MAKIQKQEQELVQLNREIKASRRDADHWKHLYLSQMKASRKPPSLRIKLEPSDNMQLHVETEKGKEITVKTETNHE